MLPFNDNSLIALFIFGCNSFAVMDLVFLIWLSNFLLFDSFLNCALWTFRSSPFRNSKFLRTIFCFAAFSFCFVILTAFFAFFLVLILAINAFLIELKLYVFAFNFDKYAGPLMEIPPAFWIIDCITFLSWTRFSCFIFFASSTFRAASSFAFRALLAAFCASNWLCSLRYIWFSIALRLASSSFRLASSAAFFAFSCCFLSSFAAFFLLLILANLLSICCLTAL